jgi:beta-glucanase (GH16 family)
MASNAPLYVSFDDGFGPIANAWNVDTSVPGEVRLAGNSAMMEYASGRDAGHGYGTYTIEAKLEGNQPGPAIIFWPADDKWPGQELDLAEITPDGSGRQYGTVHWNAGGSDAYDARVYDGVGGGFHDYQMLWEPGRITYSVDGAVKAVFTDHVPVDFANGGINNTIGFLNNNPNTSITVRDVSYVPLGGSAPVQAPAAVQAPAPLQAQAPTAALVEAWQAAPAEDDGVTWDSASGFQFDGAVDWNAIAAQVQANYDATGQWFF